MPGEESLRLILEDETGEEQEYELIGTFAFEDRDYMGLLPVEKPEEGVLILGFHPDVYKRQNEGRGKMFS